MDDNFTDYIANIIASALLAGSEQINEQLRKEHKKVVEKLINSID